MHKIEDTEGAANTNISSENNSILVTENGESTVQLEPNTANIDEAAGANVSSENNSILVTENESTVQLELNIADVDGAANAKVSSENNSILFTEKESKVQMEHNIADTDEAANANVISENNSILVTENRGSTVQLSMKSYCYTWTINNFFRCLNFCLLEQSVDIHFNFNSPGFVFENKEYFLNLSVITVSEKSNSKVKEMKIVLESKSDIASDLYIKNEVSIVDDDGSILLSCTPKKVVGTGNKKEYSYSFLPLRGTKTFVLPYKLIVRNEFSTLISEICEDTGSFLSKSDNHNVAESECCTENDAVSVSRLPKRCTKRSMSSCIRFTSWPPLERVVAEMREFLVPILAVLCVSLALVSLVNKDYDEISTFKNNKINYLIFDSAKKLNRIAEALNLSSVKENSSETLALFSKMYNSTDHVVQSSDTADHVMPVMQSIDSNISESLASKIISIVASKNDSNYTLSLASKISSFVATKVKLILGMSNDTRRV